MKIEIFQSLNAISESQWQKIASPCYPFISYKFLEAFESCGCLGSRTGWTPAYITAWEQDSLVGALLLYFKDNSYGEYIFDFSWAQAHESAGISYYPKLVSAVPFTPASSPKILLQDTLSAEDKKRTAQFLLKAALKKAQESGVSSLHALFILEGEISLFQENGFFIRHSYQFHWQNKNYSSFQDFLLGLKSKRRKEIVRERNQVLDSGVKISRFTGSSLKPQHADEWL
jgi:predicted N-acyltransferase